MYAYMCTAITTCIRVGLCICIYAHAYMHIYIYIYEYAPCLLPGVGFGGTPINHCDLYPSGYS